MASQAFKNRLKRALLIGGTCTLLLLAALVGPQFIYLLTGFIAAGVYFLFPDEIEKWCEKWFEQNEHVLIGAAVGFVGGNIPGLCVGAWLGYYVNHRYQQGLQAAQAVANTLDPVLHPFDFTSRKLKYAWERCQAGFDWLLEEEAIPAPGNVEEIREEALIVVQPPILLRQPPPQPQPVPPPPVPEVEPAVVAPPPSRLSRLKRMLDMAFPNGRLPTLI